MTFRIRELATYSFACNVGAGDRVVRVLVGIALVVAAIVMFERIELQLLSAVSAIAPPVTGVVSRCGMYYLLGMSTRPRAVDRQ